MRTYCGTRNDIGRQTVQIKHERGFLIKMLDPRLSQKVFNHSPDGFEWGYLGSGPAQLALAILLDVHTNRATCIRLHQRFKAEYVSTWGRDWSISEAEVREFIAVAAGQR